MKHIEWSVGQMFLKIASQILIWPGPHKKNGRSMINEYHWISPSVWLWLMVFHEKKCYRTKPDFPQIRPHLGTRNCGLINKPKEPSSSSLAGNFLGGLGGISGGRWAEAAGWFPNPKPPFRIFGHVGFIALFVAPRVRDDSHWPASSIKVGLCVFSLATYHQSHADHHPAKTQG